MRSLKLIDELVEAYLNGNDEASYIFNRQTREILVDTPGSLTGESEIDLDDDAATQFLVKVPQMTTPEAYDLMVSFAEKQDAEIAGQLVDVLNGRKPFQSFKDQIKGHGIENKWYDFENDYAKSRMLAWLTEYKKTEI